MYKTMALVLLISIFSVHAQDQKEMLLGKISVSELREHPYSEWFVGRYEKYDVKDKKTENLETLLDGVTIKVVMGTWCPDSRREVPRFYKILDAMEFPPEGIEIIAVDRQKTTPEHLEKDLDIKRVPTFIFYRDGQELGRIVEYPIKSLEADMVQILSGEDYEHAYAD